MPHVVLFQPEIPQNTGNISRTCAATGTPLHLIGPLGFELSDSRLKRAGLDYWSELELYVYSGFDEFLSERRPGVVWSISTKGGRKYTDAAFDRDDYLLFGRETSGLTPELYASYPLLRIPMRPSLRSLNLSNAVALVLYESLRQTGFCGLN